MACVTVPLFSSSCVPNTEPTFHSSHTPLSLPSDQIRAEPVHARYYLGKQILK